MNEKELLIQGNQTNAVPDKEIEIDLMELFYCLLENAKKIIAFALIGMLLFGAYSFVLATPVYQATCKLYVMASSDSAINLSDLQIGSYLTSDYREVFETWEVQEQVMQNLGLDYSYTKMRNMVSVTNPSGTRILAITVSSSNPKEAAAMANEYASVASGYISDTMATDEPRVLSRALEPLRPVAPRKLFNTVLGGMLGALAMIAFLTIRFLLDDKIKTADDIRKYTGMPTLAVVPTNGEFDRASGEKKNRKERY